MLSPKNRIEPTKVKRQLTDGYLHVLEWHALIELDRVLKLTLLDFVEISQIGSRFN